MAHLSVPHPCGWQPSGWSPGFATPTPACPRPLSCSDSAWLLGSPRLSVIGPSSCFAACPVGLRVCVCGEAVSLRFQGGAQAVRRSGGSLGWAQREGRQCDRARVPGPRPSREHSTAPEAVIWAQHRRGAAPAGASCCPDSVVGPVGPECSGQVMAGGEGLG